MFIALLPNGGLWICSPLILTPELAAEIDQLGPVQHILSPNKIHNQGLSSFGEHYPDAHLWASPGLKERRTDLCFRGELGDAPEPVWANTLDQLITEGNTFFSEVVFFHEDTKTLIVTDLVENIVKDTVPGYVGRSAAKAARLFGRPLPSPEFRAYTTDPIAARKKMNKIAEWPFERIVMAHGEFITENAHEVFRQVTDYLFEEASARSSFRRTLYRLLAKHQ